MKNIQNYYLELNDLVKNIQIRGASGEMDFVAGIEKAIEIVLKQNSCGNKLIFIGNGASATIASHQATDYWKNGGIRAVAFNDAALLTCVSNDFGYQHVFAKPIEMFAQPGDVLFAISSSGESQNILYAVKAAVTKGCAIITLSGFKENNSLFHLGDLNFHVPVEAYSHVEIIHHSICHYMLDIIIEKKAEGVGS